MFKAVLSFKCLYLCKKKTCFYLLFENFKHVYNVVWLCPPPFFYNPSPTPQKVCLPTSGTFLKIIVTESSWCIGSSHMCIYAEHSGLPGTTIPEANSLSLRGHQLLFAPQLEVGLHGFLPVPGWNSGWLDLAQILGWELEVPWVNECDGPVMSRTHCLAAIPLEPLFLTVLSPPPWQCSLVWEEEGVMLMST